ncbi:hypothetical protein PAXINDRAFT_18657 [Paxillus involutus ATCC 200175]|uniref:Uncharacterized protein n=1 Tax=Paxillus involutus ATCC 200175 TaxID=664439 RepID=A0A0C9SYJ2_PAXIN|nr:hypothetical protein PAXINDRAFT_18657 [Paxillus involutus ATCC 200175]
MLSTNFVTLALIFSNMRLAMNALVILRDGNNTQHTYTFKDFAFDATVTPKNNKQGANNDTLVTITGESNMVYTAKVNVGGHGKYLLLPKTSICSSLLLADFTVVVDTS